MPKLNRQTEQVIDRMQKILTDLTEHNAVVINPSVIASKALGDIDPYKNTPELMLHLAELKAREIAGRLCAKMHGPSAKKAGIDLKQLEMFSDRLQTHYPVVRENEDVYVFIDDLTQAESDAVADRMDDCGAALQKHARELRAYTKNRITKISGIV